MNLNCLARITFALFALLSANLAAKQPNIILIFTDDQGYNDLGCFGSEKIKTPNLDRMAGEGLKLTNFYAQPVCGVSRAALMTGSYPIRIGEPGNVKHLHTEMHSEEITMAEVLREAGYATAIIGKWHAGEVMPNDQGFDYFYGTPRFNGFTVYVEDTKVRSPILRNKEVVVEAVQSWDNITQDYTREALTWIETHHDKPFFLYLAHNMPHVPVGASAEFKGKSAFGPYGDTIEEIDWSCGQILDKLKALNIDDNTLVIFTSDNGPWIETTRGMKPDGKPFIPADHSGLADPLRGWKMSTWEGGCRVPFLARWPGKINEGRESQQLLTTMDLLPTFAALAEATVPDRKIDGRDASEFLLGKTESSPRDDYFYYSGCLLTGVRVGNWKLVLPRSNNPPGLGWWGRMIEEVDALHLFDLDADPAETTNLAAANPEVVASLMKRIEAARADLGDIDQTGSGARFFDEGARKLQNPIKKRAKPAQAAYDDFKPLGDLRFTFESGDLEGWKIVEGELGKPVSDAVSLPRWKEKPFNHEGKFHLSTGGTGDGFDDKQQGVIESPRFKLAGPQASFLVSGGGLDEKSLFVALVDAESGQQLLSAGGSGGAQMKRVVWDVEEWTGQTVYLRIVDRKTTGWGHLTFDDFSVAGQLAD
ncbi:MAG: arylsulfatase A-like enzyme [Verrucomicrobiales bacterium]|jgi:arylsulfatase A-like enzyme